MLPSSIIVIVATALLTLGSALLLFWAWRRGYFSDLDAQSKVIFDERDWRLERPWETADDRFDRSRQFGPSVTPERGEWGGAA